MKSIPSKNLDPNSILTRLQTRQLGRTIRILDKCTSTSDAAGQLASYGAPHGYAVLAEEQTAGRGRRERMWLSPRGGIWMTLVLRPPFVFNPLDTLPLLGALAVARTVNSSLGIKANVRWPNDIVVGRQKLAGVLAETTFIGNQLQYTLLGIGINANFHPSEIKEISPIPTTLLELLGSPIDREELICVLLLETERMYGLASSKRDEDLMNLLRELDCSREKHVKIGIGTEEISGVLEDYDTFTKIRIRTTQGSRVDLETSSVASVEYIDF